MRRVWTRHLRCLAKKCGLDVTPDSLPPACNECLFVTKLQRVMQGLLRTNRHAGTTPRFNRKLGAGKSSRLARLNPRARESAAHLLQKVGVEIAGMIVAMKQTNRWEAQVAALSAPLAVRAVYGCPLFQRSDAGWIPLTETQPTIP